MPLTCRHTQGVSCVRHTGGGTRPGANDKTSLALVYGVLATRKPCIRSCALLQACKRLCESGRLQSCANGQPELSQFDPAYTACQARAAAYITLHAHLQKVLIVRVAHCSQRHRLRGGESRLLVDEDRQQALRAAPSAWPCCSRTHEGACSALLGQRPHLVRVAAVQRLHNSLRLCCKLRPRCPVAEHDQLELRGARES